MSRTITRRQWYLLAFIQAIVIMVAAVSWWMFGSAGLIVVPLLEGAVISILLLHYLQRTRELVKDMLDQTLAQARGHMDEQARSIMGHAEASTAVYHTLVPAMPLPSMQGWAAKPDLIAVVLREVLSSKPKLVVEASSGVSTLAIGYCLKRLGVGKVIALEHDEEYASQTRQAIAAHGLEQYARVVYAPLVPHEIEGETYPWYDWRMALIDGPIDLLVVDGPPMHIRKNARYPAVPLLMDSFAHEASVLLDDGRREDETDIAKRWAGIVGVKKVTYLNLQKGAWRIDIMRDVNGG